MDSGRCPSKLWLVITWCIEGVSKGWWLEVGEMTQLLEASTVPKRIQFWFPETSLGNSWMPITPVAGDVMLSSGHCGHFSFYEPPYPPNTNKIVWRRLMENFPSLLAHFFELGYLISSLPLRLPFTPSHTVFLSTLQSEWVTPLALSWLWLVADGNIIFMLCTWALGLYLCICIKCIPDVTRSRRGQCQILWIWSFRWLRATCGY